MKMLRSWMRLVLVSTLLIFTECNGEAKASIATDDKIADSILVNGNFYTLDEKNKWAKAIAIKDGIIIYIGSMNGLGKYKGIDTKLIDLQEKFALPAFVDGHLHPLTNSYAALFQVALFDLDSADKYLSAIKTFANKSPKGQWIIGAGFDAFAFSQQKPKKEVLDSILPNRAIAIVDRDIHSMLVNSKALEIMGITKDTPNPDGGSIQRDAKGEATGLLIDDSAMNLARGFFPTATKEQYKISLLWMQKWLNREGITTAHDAWIEFDKNYYQAFNELAQEGKLTVRYRGSWFIDPNGDYMEDIDYGFELSKQFTHPHFQVKSFKFLTDNVLEQDSALLFDGSGGITGVKNWQQADMLKAYAKIDKAKYQIHVHTVGDAGVSITLDALQAAQVKNGKRDSRHSLAHVEVATPKDITRIGQLGLTTHLTTINLERENDYFESSTSKFHPVKSLIDAGSNVTIVSDYATSNPNLMSNIFGAIQRDNSETARLNEMLKAATINGAYANFLENETGSLKVGKKADIVVLSKNLFAIKKEEIPHISIEMTFFEGKRVH